MFLTIASARLPCCTTLSRLPRNVSVSSLISVRALWSNRYTAQDVLQLIDQFGGDPRKIVDEIERVLDLMRDACGQLAERRQLLGLDKAVLSSAQVLQRGCDVLEQARVLDCYGDCAPKVLIKSTVFWGKAPGVLRRTTSMPTTSSPRSSGATNRAR